MSDGTFELHDKRVDASLVFTEDLPFVLVRTASMHVSCTFVIFDGDQAAFPIHSRSVLFSFQFMIYDLWATNVHTFADMPLRTQVRAAPTTLGVLVISFSGTLPPTANK